MDTECSLYPWLFFGIGQEEKWYLPRLLRHFNVLAGERMRVLPGGTNPQEGWPVSGETQQSLRRENIDVRGKKRNLLERKEQARACKLNRGTGSTEKTLVWRAKSTKTCMNVQGWSKKSLKSSFWGVFSFLKWGWQVVCSVVPLWILPCKRSPAQQEPLSLQTR